MFALLYTTCGSDIHCSNVNIEIPSETSPILSKGEVKVWPNPANDDLNITGITETTKYRILKVTGITIKEGILEPGSNSVQLQKIIPGIYILEMTSENGEREIIRVVKE